MFGRGSWDLPELEAGCKGAKPPGGGEQRAGREVTPPASGGRLHPHHILRYSPAGPWAL